MPDKADLKRMALGVLGGIYVGWGGLIASRQMEGLAARAMSGRPLSWPGGDLAVGGSTMLLLLAAACGAALWVAYVFGPQAHPARLLAAATFLILTAHTAFHISWWSRQGHFVLARPDVIRLMAGLASAALLAFLPTPRGWRASGGHRPAALLAGLWLLPAVIAVPPYYQAWAVSVQMRPQFAEVAALDFPLMPDAQELEVSQYPGEKTLHFKLAREHSVAAVTEFYNSWFLARGWKRTGAVDWGDQGGYSARGLKPAQSRPEWPSANTWESPDGEVEVLLGLTYKVPPGPPPDLPLGPRVQDWVRVDRVNLQAFAVRRAAR
jgi:hypothetical protein